jgi:hypothetical protein
MTDFEFTFVKENLFGGCQFFIFHENRRCGRPTMRGDYCARHAKEIIGIGERRKRAVKRVKRFTGE